MTITERAHVADLATAVGDLAAALAVIVDQNIIRADTSRDDLLSLEADVRTIAVFLVDTVAEEDFKVGGTE